MPEVRIIIVNYRTSLLLKKCLASIYRQKNCSFNVFVVDNASNEDALEDCIAEYPHVRWIKNEKNIGFAAANNIILKEASSAYTLLLNPDTELLEEDVLRIMLNRAQKLQSGILGVKLTYPNGMLQQSVRNLPTSSVLLLLLSKLHIIFKRLALYRNFMRTDFLYNSESKVEQVSGACFLISPKVISTIGLLDERYWIWFEEVDYCKRAIDAGLSIWFTPYTTCMHVGGVSFSGKMPFWRQWQFTKSAIAYAKKHFGLLASIFCICVAPVGMLISILTPKRARQLSYKLTK